MNAVLAALQADGRQVCRSWLCRVLDVARSTAYYQPRPRQQSERVDEVMAERVRQVIDAEPSFGIRSVWAWLNFAQGVKVNRKKVERIMRVKGWTMARRRSGHRPRVEVFKSEAELPNQRWATDLAMVHCGRDGWCCFVPVIDCCTRELLGWELDRTGRAKTAERALEAALLQRFGWLRGAPEGMALRHDNGLVFGSRLYRGVVADYGLKQEYITPYTPQENGMCERFIRTFKEQCVWLHRFESIEEARATIATWMHKYNTKRPHQALNYLTPQQQYQKLCTKIAQ